MDAVLLSGAGGGAGVAAGAASRGSAPLLGGKKGKIKGSGGCLLPTGAAAESGGREAVSCAVCRVRAPQRGCVCVLRARGQRSTAGICT